VRFPANSGGKGERCLSCRAQENESGTNYGREQKLSSALAVPVSSGRRTKVQRRINPPTLQQVVSVLERI
jgi:hypothetical protein